MPGVDATLHCTVTVKFDKLPPGTNERLATQLPLICFWYKPYSTPARAASYARALSKSSVTVLCCAVFSVITATARVQHARTRCGVLKWLLL